LYRVAHRIGHASGKGFFGRLFSLLFHFSLELLKRTSLSVVGTVFCLDAGTFVVISFFVHLYIYLLYNGLRRLNLDEQCARVLNAL